MTKAQKTIKVKVFKFDPKVDKKPHYKTFQVPRTLWITLMEALEYINFELGGAVAYRYSLTRTAPAVMINGVPSVIGEMITEDEITVEPLPILPVIKDLVVDLDKIYKIRNRLRLYHQPTRPYPGTGLNPLIIPDYLERYPYLPPSVHGCIDCFACLATCPAVEVAWRDFAGPYYMVQLIKYMMHPEDRGDRVGTAFREGVFNCTMCGKCEKVCLKDQPPPIPIPEMVIERLRQDAVEGGMTPLPYKEFTKLVQETGRIVPLKDKPLIERLPEIVDVKNPVKEVALFTGCLIDYNLQNSGLALTKILNKNKVRIHIPKEQQCCGSPFFRNGQSGIGRNLVKINTKIFEALKVETVVTACAECGATLKKDYPKILGRDPEFKVMDITEFLANEIELDTEKMKELKMTVTFSDPCYLKAWQGISKEPREILKKIPGIKLVEMEKSDACCGAGGGLRLGNPDLSMEIAKTKIPMILESSAQAVVTSCPWCQLNLIDRLEDKGPEVLSLVELLERKYSK